MARSTITLMLGRKPPNLATLRSAHFGRDVRRHMIGWKHPADWLRDLSIKSEWLWLIGSSANDDVGHAHRQMSLKKIQIQTDGSSNAKGLFHQRSCLQIHMKRFVIRQMWKCTFEAFESVDMKCKYETEDLNVWIWNTNMKY